MKLLGIYSNYIDTHPLWHTQQLRQKYDYSILTTDIANYNIIHKIDPDVIIADSFCLNDELHKECGTILLITDSFFHHKESKQETITKIKKFHEIICCSLNFSNKLLKEYEIESKLVYPIIDCDVQLNPRYIVYDEKHPYAGYIQSRLRNEHLFMYTSIFDLNQAKVFLPLLKDQYDGRLPYAVNAGVPIICNNKEELTEFIEGTGVIIDGNFTKDTWLHATKTMLRDRLIVREKLKTIANRYRDMGHLEDKIKRAFQNKPTKATKTQTHTQIREETATANSLRIVNQRNKRHPSYKRSPIPLDGLSQNIFLTGGVGDVLALESFMSDEQRMLISTICYATNKQSIIETLFRALPNFICLQQHIIVYNDFSHFWCFAKKSECERYVGRGNLDFNESDDWGIMEKFPLINMGLMKYNQSSFLNYHLADLNGFQIPPNFMAICPYSTDKRIHSRDFDDRDWAVVIYKLIKSNMRGIVLNTGNEYVPENPVIINLSNKTTILEAIEILKRAKGYIGIDSSLSVLAAKLFDYPQLIIKSQNDHCYNNKHIYYAPKTDFNFLGPHIDKLLNI